MSEEIMSSRKLAAPVVASALIAVLMFASMCLPLHEDWNVANRVRFALDRNCSRSL